MQSPEYVQTSLAAAMTLGLKNGLFYREAKLKALNLLLTYEEGCAANCAYCGLAHSRRAKETFIRVSWPIYSLKEIIERSLSVQDQIERICVSMVTHPRAREDLCYVIQELRTNTPYPISALITPTMITQKEHLAKIRSAGADLIGIAIDGATEPIFSQYRGQGVKGPHKWSQYWDTVREAIDIFGFLKVGIHLIVGLGETEAEMVQTIQDAYRLGALTHLFSFFPEKGTQLAEKPQPSIGSYRRIQLARYLINEHLVSIEQMEFNSKGQIIDFGLNKASLADFINKGDPFLTSGCPGADGTVACNRPYGNERPSQPIRNFPFQPNGQDLKDIWQQLLQYD